MNVTHPLSFFQGALVPTGKLSLVYANYELSPHFGLVLDIRWRDEAGIEWELAPINSLERLQPVQWPTNIKARYHLKFAGRQMYAEADSLEAAIEQAISLLVQTHEHFRPDEFVLHRVTEARNPL